MTVEEQAEQCRSGLDASLRSVHKLTSDPQSSAELLLHRMNGVLHAAVATNFGSVSHDAIGALFESIDREHISMLGRFEDMPMLFFARAFAVVIEEAVRQLHQMRQANTATAPRNSSCASGVDSMRSDTLREEKMIVKKEEKNEEEPEGSLATRAAAATTVSVGSQDVVSRLQQQHKPAAAAAVRHPQRDMQLPHPKRADRILDYSPEAVEGRITIYDVPGRVKETEIRAVLRPYGRLFYFDYPNPTAPFRSVFVKLQSNEAADAAVKALDHSKIGGGTVRAKRLDYWTKCINVRPLRYSNASDLPVPRFGCSKEPSPVAVAADAVASAVDSDDETEELRDNLSNCSFFSVD